MRHSKRRKTVPRLGLYTSGPPIVQARAPCDPVVCYDPVTIYFLPPRITQGPGHLFLASLQREWMSDRATPLQVAYHLKSLPCPTPYRLASKSPNLTYLSAASFVASSTTLGATPASNASCHRSAHKHHLSPGRNPGNEGRRGVIKSFPRLRVNVRNGSSITAATTCRPSSFASVRQYPSRNHPVRGDVPHGASAVPRTLRGVSECANDDMARVRRVKRARVGRCGGGGGQTGKGVSGRWRHTRERGKRLRAGRGDEAQVPTGHARQGARGDEARGSKADRSRKADDVVSQLLCAEGLHDGVSQQLCAEGLHDGVSQQL